MIYRVDVILADGTRRRANYDSDAPDVIEMNRFRFGPRDVMLQGASFVTTSREASQALQSNGFNTVPPRKRDNFCIRLDREMSEQIYSVAQQTRRKEAAVIRIAIDYWLKHGHPIE
jgi:hypothetical protein